MLCSFLQYDEESQYLHILTLFVYIYTYIHIYIYNPSLLELSPTPHPYPTHLGHYRAPKLSFLCFIAGSH